jgi:hypothetical protein
LPELLPRELAVDFLVVFFLAVDFLLFEEVFDLLDLLFLVVLEAVLVFLPAIRNNSCSKI